MDCVDKHMAAWHIPRHVNGGGRHRGGLYSIWRQGGILCEKKIAKFVKTKAFKKYLKYSISFFTNTLVWYRMRTSLNIIGHLMGETSKYCWLYRTGTSKYFQLLNGGPKNLANDRLPGETWTVENFLVRARTFINIATLWNWEER